MTNKLKKYSSVFKNYYHIVYGADYSPEQWLNNPEIIKEDIRLMKLAGINSVSIGMFSWEAIEPQEDIYNFDWLDNIMNLMAENDIKVILATPSGARPAWMDKKYPEVLRVSSNRIKNLHGGRHNHCYTSPYYRNKVYSINEMLAKRYKNHKALSMWHVSNEYGGECHCNLCQEAFRDWLKNKYHNDINELNEQWWTSFWSHTFSNFDEIESPSEIGENLIHGMNLDWKRFVTYQTKSFYENEIKPLRDITPNIPLTTNFQGTYKGLNPWNMAPVIDIISWDNYPRWGQYGKTFWQTASDIGFVHDINRSLKNGKPFFMMESTPSLVNWHEINKLKKPKLNELSSIQAVAHGADSIQYFQWRKSRGASEKFHGAIVDHYGKEDTRVFKEVKKLGENLRKLDDIVGTSVNPKVAIIYDWENVWAIEDLQGLNNYREYEETCKQHYQSFWKKGISVDVINMNQPFSNYKMIIAPMLYMLKPKVANNLKEFVNEGGTLILTYLTGYVNENDLCFLGGFPGDGLIDVAGLRAEEIDALYKEEKNSIIMSNNNAKKKEYKSGSLCEIIYPKESCEILAVYGEDFYKGMPVVTKNKYGKGHCYYIATRPEQQFLDDFYENIKNELDLKCCIKDIILPEGITVQTRYDEENVFYFIMNFTQEEKEIEINNDKQYIDIINDIKLENNFILEPFGYKIIRE